MYHFVQPTHCARQWSGMRGEEDAVSALAVAQVTVEESRPDVLWFYVDSLNVMIHLLLLFSCL